MDELFRHALDAPVANILVISGLLFLAVAVIGRIQGKIEPGLTSRVLSGVLGGGLLFGGVFAHAGHDQPTSAEGGQASRRKDVAVSWHRGWDPRHPLTGPWRNQDTNTSGITRLMVRYRDGAYFVHAWSRCAPSDCDWGSTPAALQGGSLLADWEQGPMHRSVRLVAEADRLSVALDTSFHDGRPSKRSQHRFMR